MKKIFLQNFVVCNFTHPKIVAQTYLYIPKSYLKIKNILLAIDIHIRTRIHRFPENFGNKGRIIKAKDEIKWTIVLVRQISSNKSGQKFSKISIERFFFQNNGEM